MANPVPQATPIEALHPADWNPRSIKDERFQNLCRSIEADPEFLWRRPVLAQADGTLYAGNMRYRAAQHLGHATIPAIVEEVPDQLARERALRDNAQWGDWAEDDLAKLLEGLRAEGSDLDLLGFDDRELQALLNKLGSEGGLTDPDDIPEPPAEPITKPGDLWLLGDHRILCGDSTDPHDVAGLLPKGFRRGGSTEKGGIGESGGNWDSGRNYDSSGRPDEAWHRSGSGWRKGPGAMSSRWSVVPLA